ncbi:MAG TPA: DMT family transporter [Treponemataceae bacterium]|nr:DMT family transporter [Treponemataceae bacterium]
MTRRIRPYAYLFCAALLWGVAFAAQRLGGKSIGSFSFNAIRFLVGAISLLPLVVWRRRAQRLRTSENVPASNDFARRDSTHRGHPRFSLVLWGALCGIIVFCGASLQQIGLQWTTAGKAAFLTGLYIVLIPAAGLFVGKRPGWGLAVGSTLAAVGLYLLSVRDGFSVSLGDWLEIAGALFWTAHILVVARLSTRLDPVKLALAQFVACGTLSAAAAFLTEGFGAETLALAFSPGPNGALIPVLYSGILSIGAAYTLQILGQKGVSPGPAALIMSLEAVFAALGGWLVLNETMDARALAGAALMLTGMISAQLIPPSKKSR